MTQFIMSGWPCPNKWSLGCSGFLQKHILPNNDIVYECSRCDVSFYSLGSYMLSVAEAVHDRSEFLLRVEIGREQKE